MDETTARENAPAVSAPAVSPAAESDQSRTYARTERRVLPFFFLLLSLFSFWGFPGHAWLQQDTQIYMPILEHLWDGSVLKNDILVERPHVAFTVYDEIALGLRWITRRSFHTILTGEEIVFRAAGLWGVFLIGTALGLDAIGAGFVTLIWSLGATITGPAVLTVEYEPVPRGFAVPLLMLAIGLAAHRHWLWSGIAAAIAFIVHPPAVYPFWIIYGLLALRPRKGIEERNGLIALAGSLVILLIASRLQQGITESQHFFERLTPELERLQRMRASYNWVSTWSKELVLQHVFLFAVCLLACWRLWPRMPDSLKPLAIDLPAIGVISMPVSWLLLEHWRWAFIPQLQPMRALLFVTALAVILAAVAGVHSARERRWVEAVAWFLLPWLIPMRTDLIKVPPTRQIVLCVTLAVAAAAATYVAHRRAMVGRIILAGFLLVYAIIPVFGQVSNYPFLHTPELRAVSDWARTSTPKSAVFLFPDNGKQNYAGLFRSEALRAVYVDWKSGGQVNYLKEFGEEWWSRWTKAMAEPFDREHPDRYRSLGIDYIVLDARNQLPDRTPAYRNSRYVVYRLG